jgi:hypothetical protein
MIFQDNFIDTVENALIPNMLTQNGVSQIWHWITNFIHICHRWIVNRVKRQILMSSSFYYFGTLLLPRRCYPGHACVLHCVRPPACSTSCRGIFSYFGLFNQYLRNEPGQIFFPNLDLFNRASLVGVTHEGVAPYALAQLRGLACARSPTWCHIGMSRAKQTGATASCHLQ